MKKLVFLVVSLIATIFPGFLKAEAQGASELTGVNSQKKKVQAEKELFLKLREAVDPNYFRRISDYNGMQHRNR